MYTEHSPPRSKFQSVSLYNQPFLRHSFVENRKCAEWPQNDLNHWSVKSTLCTLNTQISLRFALRSLVFQIIEVFGFPIGYNGEIKKSLKIGNSKFQKSKTVILWRPLRRKFRKGLKGFKSDLREDFDVLAPIVSHVNENEKKKSLKIITKTPNFKIQNCTFVRTTEKKIQKKFERIQKWFEGGVALWSFGSHHRVPC